MNRTLVICKPDAVERGLVGEILGRFERKGFTIAAAEMRTLNHDTLSRHYDEHANKDFYDELVAFMSRGPSLVAVLQGPHDTWKVVRAMIGATDPLKAAAGTIRGDLAMITTENLVHGSDSASSAAREIPIFFPGLAS